MTGYRPANSGNRSRWRLGPVVSRRLRKADIRVSSPERMYRFPGVFVSAQEDHITVLVDGMGGSRRTAEEIAEVVRGWGMEPEVLDGPDFLSSFVSFRYLMKEK